VAIFRYSLYYNVYYRSLHTYVYYHISNKPANVLHYCLQGINNRLARPLANTLRLDTVAEARTTVGKTVGLSRKGLTLSAADIVSEMWSWIHLGIRSLRMIGYNFTEYNIVDFGGPLSNFRIYAESFHITFHKIVHRCHYTTLVLFWLKSGTSLVYFHVPNYACPGVCIYVLTDVFGKLY
jgi:hypothetical protein